jgi:hypothetical protein
MTPSSSAGLPVSRDNPRAFGAASFPKGEVVATTGSGNFFTASLTAPCGDDLTLSFENGVLNPKSIEEFGRRERTRLRQEFCVNDNQSVIVARLNGPEKTMD